MIEPIVVNLHYAKLLRMNKFPSPVRGEGQYWYRLGRLIMLTEENGDIYESNPFSENWGFELQKIERFDRIYFAPDSEIISAAYSAYIIELIKLNKFKNAIGSLTKFYKAGSDPNILAQLWVDLVVESKY